MISRLAKGSRKLIPETGRERVKHSEKSGYLFVEMKRKN